jgi:hypothetical protein
MLDAPQRCVDLSGVTPLHPTDQCDHAPNRAVIVSNPDRLRWRHNLKHIRRSPD